MMGQRQCIKEDKTKSLINGFLSLLVSFIPLITLTLTRFIFCYFSINMWSRFSILSNTAPLSIAVHAIP
jgi:hypothetical protein